VGGFLGARGSPFPAGFGFGFGLGLRLGLPGLGASATVLRGFGAVCDLVFIPRRRPLCTPGAGVYARFGAPRGVEEPDEWRGRTGEAHGKGETSPDARRRPDR